jgi:hypothetical protein
MRLSHSLRRRAFFAALALAFSFTSNGLPQGNVAYAADEPQLAFDFGRTLECRDVTPPEFAESYPDERIVECTLRLSIYLSRGDMSAIDAVRVEINDLDQRLRVHDFSPRTVLASKLSADVEWTKTTESTHELGASLGGELPACIGDVVANVTPSINAAKGGREVITEKQMRVAPKHVVVASGTINHEHGVFFTLRPSEQTALEGVHELKVAFIVPAAWRGDAVRVSCQASGEQKMLWVKQQKVWAEMSNGVALYLAGDVDARRAAERRVRE